MAAAGYSGTPLQKKLGFKEGWRVAFVGDVPAGFGEELEGLDVAAHPTRGIDGAVLFTRARADLAARAPKLLGMLGDTGMLWVSWPKKSSGVPTDLTEDVLREVVLPTGWVDTKVCAVDETWSGLRFVKRVSERAGTSRTRP